jgi:hypothetical protein
MEESLQCKNGWVMPKIKIETDSLKIEADYDTYYHKAVIEAIINILKVANESSGSYTISGDDMARITEALETRAKQWTF